MCTSGKPWWSCRYWPFSWLGRDGASPKGRHSIARLLARAAVFAILFAPLWWAASYPYQHALAFIAKRALISTAPAGSGYGLEPRGRSYAVIAARRGGPTLKFRVRGELIHAGMVLMMALLAASPLSGKRFLKALPLCVAILFFYHLFWLYVAAKCPYPLMARPLAPEQLYYLHLMGRKTRIALSNLNIFNRTVGWQLAPLLIWGAAAWKRWV